MNKSEDEFSNNKNLIDARREKTKEELLDEEFKKTESSKVMKKEEKKIVRKNPFLKSGILILIIAIIFLLLVDNLPWMYLRYEDPEHKTFEEFFYKDFEDVLERYYPDDLNKTDAHNDIHGLFESKCSNCSNNSQNYIGLGVKDFSNTPRMVFYAFICLVATALFFIFFQIYDKIKTVSMENFALMHSIFAAVIIIVNSFILVLIIKFFAAYLLLYHNSAFINLDELRIVFVMPLVLIFFAPIMIKGATAIIKMNFNELQKKLQTDIPENSFSAYKFGGRPR